MMKLWLATCMYTAAVESCNVTSVTQRRWVTTVVTRTYCRSAVGPYLLPGEVRRKPLQEYDRADEAEWRKNPSVERDLGSGKLVRILTDPCQLRYNLSKSNRHVTDLHSADRMEDFVGEGDIGQWNCEA